MLRGFGRPWLDTTGSKPYWGWSCGPRDPTPGTMQAGVLPRTLVRTDDLYVTVWSFNRLAEPASVELARALRPVTDG